MLQKLPEYEVIEFARTQLTLPDKLDPADEMSWQHYLYSKLGKRDTVSEDVVPEKTVSGNEKNKEKIIEETVERIVAMAKVLYGLHMVSIWMRTEFVVYSKQNGHHLVMPFNYAGGLWAYSQLYVVFGVDASR